MEETLRLLMVKFPNGWTQHGRSGTHEEPQIAITATKAAAGRVNQPLCFIIRRLGRHDPPLAQP